MLDIVKLGKYNLKGKRKESRSGFGMAVSRKDTGKSSSRKTTRTTKEKKARDISKSPPTKKILGELPVTTELYSAADVDVLIANGKLLEDEDIPGDFYTISIKSGRLIVKKVANAG